jgi:acetolactate synthase-1/2/3 large subunit
VVTVAQYIANFLHKNGIADVFMLSGGGAIHLDDAVTNHPGLREICIKNEATGPMMAKAYARMKNNFGVVYVTTGPGGANAITGVVECFVDSSPVMIISGQALLLQTTNFRQLHGVRSFGVQELNIVELVKSVTKYAVMITKSEDIRYELERSLSIMKEGRPGPVWIDVPLDIQSELVDPDSLRGWRADSVKPTVQTINHKDLYDIICDLKVSKCPLIVAGQGVRDAVGGMKTIAEMLDAPIILSRMGLDTLPFSYRHNMGIGGIKGQMYNKQIMREADVVIAVGTSLSVAFAGSDLSFFNRDAKIYMVDIESGEVQKFRHKIQAFIQTNASYFFTALKSGLGESGWVTPQTEWMSTCVERKTNGNAAKLAPRRNPIDIYYLAKMMDDMSTNNDVFVDDAGSIYYVAGQTLSFDKGQIELTSGAFASMGNAIPLAIGAAIANSDKRILAITGDGSLETNVQELKTLSYYDLNVKLFVINNGGYLSMRDHGRTTVDERNAMLNLKKVAAAYDIPYYCIENCEDFEWVRTVIKAVGPAFFEVMCDDKQKLILPT